MEKSELFTQLINIISTLLAPDGCPWDREQTMLSIRSSVVEEACELKEAIEMGDNAHICEELGDLFLNAVFLAKLAEKEKRFTMDDALKAVCEKLIRRHPHVFGNATVADSEAVRRQWEKIKESEKGKERRTSSLDSIPKGLHVVARTQQVLKKISRTAYPKPRLLSAIHSEKELGDELLSLVQQAQNKGFDLEQALRKQLNAIEADFRAFEEKSFS